MPIFELMNILLVSTSEMNGGAAIAARRLLFALNRYGESHGGSIKAKMLVRDKSTDCPDVIALKTSKFEKKFRFAFERGVIWINNHFSKENLFQVSIANTGYDITRLKEFKEADVIHLHWTQQGMLSLRDMEKIFKSGKKIVWTMHDMWACTGICHHSEECDKYSGHCYNCQYLKGKKSKDLAYRIFSKKESLFTKYDFQVITCSDWLKSKAQASALFKGKNLCTIANPIDSSTFHPADKLEVRQKLGLPIDEKLVLFASQKVTDKRKGIDYLVEAAKILKDKGIKLSFVVMGQNSEQLSSMLGYPVYSMGYVSSVERAAMIYQAVDLFVTPSLMENLPNTIAEALSCGTPCVGFNVGGIPEMIDHKVNGYIAEYKNAEDFARGIEWILNNDILSSDISDTACGKFDENSIVKQILLHLYLNNQ